MKKRLNVGKDRAEKKKKVHQRKELLIKEQYIEKPQGLDQVVLQNKFTTPAMLHLSSTQTCLT